MSKAKTELKRSFGKVKNPIKTRKFLRLTEFTDELIEKAKADFELIISDRKNRTIVFHRVKCKLPPKCFMLLEMLLMYLVLEFDIESKLTMSKNKVKTIKEIPYTWVDTLGMKRESYIGIEPIKQTQKVLYTYNFSPTETSKCIYKLKTYLEKAFISSGKSMADLDKVFPALISTHECAKWDINYTIRTRYIYEYQK